MEKEIWKQAHSFPEIEASSWGRIKRKPFRRSMPHGRTRWYQPKPTYGVRAATSGLAGFRMIYRYQGLKATVKISRLVCEAFHGPSPFNGAVVMHIDDDPSNNRPENLKWATQKENLNSEQFINYCKSRTGTNHPRNK